MAWNNEIRIIGRLSKEPSIYNAAVKFDVAVNRGKGKDGVDLGADFISCVAFNRQMESVKNMHKGDEVYVEGSLKLDSYKKTDGSTGYSTSIMVNIVKLFATKIQQPAFNQSYQQQNSYQKSMYQEPTPGNFNVNIAEDDLPF